MTKSKKSISTKEIKTLNNLRLSSENNEVF